MEYSYGKRLMKTTFMSPAASMQATASSDWAMLMMTASRPLAAAARTQSRILLVSSPEYRKSRSTPWALADSVTALARVERNSSVLETT